MRTRRDLRCSICLLFLAAVLAACAVPAPTADTAQIVEATLTALAPASAVVMAVATAEPELPPSRTPEPTLTPSATSLPVAVPGGWVEYRHDELGLSFHLPPDWHLEVDERGSTIRIPGDRGFVLQDFPWLCEGTAKQVLQCAVETTERGFSEGWHNFQLKDAREVVAGEWTVYVVDHNIDLGGPPDLPWQFWITHVFVPQAKERAFYAYILIPPDGIRDRQKSTRIRADELSVEIRNTFYTVLSTLVVATPAP